MKSKASWHYIFPIVALLVINFIYFFPALQGNVLEQDDIMLGYAKGKEIRDYREAKDEEPLWTQTMFSGMPTFQISTKYPANWLYYGQQVISWVGGKSSSIYIVFSLMLGFYLLLISQRINPWLAAIGGLAFAFSAFFIISYGAGHNAKVRTAAYFAPVIMGVLLTFRGNRWAGFGLTALFLGLNINSNHFQITYYLALTIGILAVVEFIYALRQKELKAFAQSSGVLLLAAILAIGPNISKLWTTYEYTQETMRGGQSELSNMKESEGGLTFDYAMNWSYGIAETFNLVIADFSGGGMAQTYEGTEIHDQYYRNIVGSLTQQGTPRKQAEKQANQFIGSMFYWGEQSLVNGGYYVGAVVFFLFVLGLFIVSGRIKWWVAGAVVLALFLAWGKNFRAFNEVMFEYLPIYNKFRVPSMAFTMAFFAMPFLGFLALGRILQGQIDPALLRKRLLHSLYITGGICLFFVLLGGGLFDFTGPNDSRLQEQGIALDILEDDRISIMRKSALKTLLFCALTFGLIWLWQQKRLALRSTLAVLAILVMADQWSFVRQHLNADDFVSEREYENAFAATPADRKILQDEDPHYRVYNTTAGLTSDSYTSYYHKSIGGYHGAKLIRYQDLIDRQLSQGSQPCFNMLNAKWYIGQGQQGQNYAQQNPEACGNAWFVPNIKWVKDADAEMDALGDFDPLKTVVIDQRYKDYLGSNGPDYQSSSSIELTAFDLKHMTYEAEVSGEDHFAVFSEIYYEGGDQDWKTYLNGEEVKHIRVNYLLRGMLLPPGKHKVEFIFEPRSYFLGENISGVFSVLIVLALLGAGFRFWKKPQAPAS